MICELLEIEGLLINHKKVERIWRKEGLLMLIAGYSAYPVLNPWFTDKFLMNIWFEPFDVHEKNINMMLVDQIYPEPCVIRKARNPSLRIFPYQTESV